MTTSARPPAVGAQVVTPPVEIDVRVVIACANARAAADAHVHLVGGRGWPARYLQVPTLACDELSEQRAETTTIWRDGSIWHVAITAEAGGAHATCEKEGLRLPAEVRCPVGAGEVAFTIEAKDAVLPDADPAGAPPPPPVP